MAPLLSLLLAFALASSVLASPHAARNLYNHHRAVANPIDARADAPSFPLPRRKQRSLNRRCLPRPSNATSSVPSNTPTAPPMNLAPPPSVSPSPSSSSTSSSSSWPSYPPAETPTPTPTPTPSSSSSSPPPAQTSSSSGSSGLPSFLSGTQSGQATWYSTGLGACGITNNDGDHIVAVSHLLFDAMPGYNGVDPNTNPICKQPLTISYGGKSVAVTVTDRCEACALTDLDLSPSAFSALADESVGRFDMTWNWNKVW